MAGWGRSGVGWFGLPTVGLVVEEAGCRVRWVRVCAEVSDVLDGHTILDMETGYRVSGSAVPVGVGACRPRGRPVYYPGQDRGCRSASSAVFERSVAGSVTACCGSRRTTTSGSAV